MAIRTRMVKTCERLEQSSRELPPLREGDTVLIQNQNGPKPKKWDKEGTVIQTGENDQYLVRVHGTGRVTLRNRRFLRKSQLRGTNIEDVGLQPVMSAGTFETTSESKPFVEKPVNVPPTPVGKYLPSQALNVPQMSDVREPSPQAEEVSQPIPTVDPVCNDVQQSLAQPSENHAPDPHLPRRSMRATAKRTVYDASMGKQVLPSSK